MTRPLSRAVARAAVTAAMGVAAATFAPALTALAAPEAAASVAVPALGSVVPALGSAVTGSAGTSELKGPASFDDGLWWYRSMRVAQLNQDGATGKGVTVGVIDGPVYAAAPELAQSLASSKGYCTNAGGRSGRLSGPGASHATEMAVLIAGNGRGTYHGRGVKGVAPQAKVRTYAIGGDSSGMSELLTCVNTPKQSIEATFVRALDQAVKDGVKVVNLSFGGGLATNSATVGAIVAAERAGVILVAAGGNSATDQGWPNYANGVVNVNALNRTAHLASFAPNGEGIFGVSTSAPGVQISVGHFASLANGGRWGSNGWSTGSSGATALTSGGLAAVWSKFPKATANQILQLMVHSMGYRVTKGANGKPAYFTAFKRTGGLVPVGSTHTGFGWGVFDPADMAEGNPLAYPDTNPLLSNDPSIAPTTAQITGQPAAATATPDPSSSTSTGAATTASGPTPAASSPRVSAAAEAAPNGSSGGAPVLAWGGAAAVIAAVAGGLVILRRRRVDASSGSIDAAPQVQHAAQSAPHSQGEPR